mmetsp:Transcript_4506/g.7225  ORF Transcript_4506/g.7225 Transcript_4506/m.7225 type:complete len:295 (+) Transcript_4506:571-1455(+)
MLPKKPNSAVGSIGSDRFVCAPSLSVDRCATLPVLNLGSTAAPTSSFSLGPNMPSQKPHDALFDSSSASHQRLSFSLRGIGFLSNHTFDSGFSALLLTTPVSRRRLSSAATKLPYSLLFHHISRFSSWVHASSPSIVNVSRIPHVTIRLPIPMFCPSSSLRWSHEPLSRPVSQNEEKLLSEEPERLIGGSPLVDANDMTRSRRMDSLLPAEVVEPESESSIGPWQLLGLYSERGVRTPASTVAAGGDPIGVEPGVNTRPLLPGLLPGLLPRLLPGLLVSAVSCTCAPVGGDAAI